MKYLCLVYGPAGGFDARGVPGELPGESASRACVASLSHDGRLLAGELLTEDYTATRIRVRQGRVAIFDGPMAAQTLPLTAFLLLQARDLNEAILLASDIPLARVGWVEIRPVREMS